MSFDDHVNQALLVSNEEPTEKASRYDWLILIAALASIAVPFAIIIFKIWF